MYSFRRLQAIILGHDDDCDHDHEKDALCSTLRASDVPVSLADCRSCSDPCDLGILPTCRCYLITNTFLNTGHHEAYPRRFDIDMDTQMLGSVKPYHRQVSFGLSSFTRPTPYRPDRHFHGSLRLGARGHRNNGFSRSLHASGLNKFNFEYPKTCIPSFRWEIFLSINWPIQSLTVNKDINIKRQPQHTQPRRRSRNRPHLSRLQSGLGGPTFHARCPGSVG